MISCVHTRAKSRLSWQNYVQEVVYKKVDVKNATPAVAERPCKQARPRFQSLRWKTNALWSQRGNLPERLPSIDEDISSGVRVPSSLGTPKKRHGSGSWHRKARVLPASGICCKMLWVNEYSKENKNACIGQFTELHLRCRLSC